MDSIQSYYYLNYFIFYSYVILTQFYRSIIFILSLIIINKNQTQIYH